MSKCKTCCAVTSTIIPLIMYYCRQCGTLHLFNHVAHPEIINKYNNLTRAMESLMADDKPKKKKADNK